MPASADEGHFVLDQRGGNVARDLFVLTQHLAAQLDVAFADTGMTPAQHAVYSQFGARTSTPRSGRPGPRGAPGHAARPPRHDGAARSPDPDPQRQRRPLAPDRPERRRVGRVAGSRERMRAAVRMVNARLSSGAECDKVRRVLGFLDDAVLCAARNLRARPNLTD